MGHVVTLARRELAAYFFGPMAYLVLLAFQVIAFVNFTELVETLSRPQSVYSGGNDALNLYIPQSLGFWIAILFAVPALTMRLISEERRMGTIETLLTTPVDESQIVVAKWLAGLVMYVVLLVPFVLYLPFLRHYGDYPFDLGPIVSLLIGLTTLGMMFIAIGVFFSALTRSQVVAAVGSFSALFLILIFSLMAYTGAYRRQSAWTEAIRYVTVLSQVREFGSGLVDLRYIALHLSVTVFLLALTVQVIRTRRGA